MHRKCFFSLKDEKLGIQDLRKVMSPLIFEMSPTGLHSKFVLLMSAAARGDWGTGPGKSWRSLNVCFFFLPTSIALLFQCGVLTGHFQFLNEKV